jgi:hypothetical protein
MILAVFTIKLTEEVPSLMFMEVVLIYLAEVISHVYQLCKFISQ